MFSALLLAKGPGDLAVVLNSSYVHKSALGTYLIWERGAPRISFSLRATATFCTLPRPRGLFYFSRFSSVLAPGAAAFELLLTTAAPPCPDAFLAKLGGGGLVFMATNQTQWLVNIRQ